MSDFSTVVIVGMCFSAFGIGYAGGALQRVFRRAVETLE